MSASKAKLVMLEPELQGRHADIWVVNRDYKYSLVHIHIHIHIYMYIHTYTYAYVYMYVYI